MSGGKPGRKRLLNVVARILFIIGGVSVVGLLLVMMALYHTQDQEQDVLLTTKAVEDIENNVRLMIRSRIHSIMDEHILAIERLRSEPGDASANLLRYRDTSDLPDYMEVNIIDREGVIIATTNDAYIGYDMNEGEQSSEFLSSVLSRDDGFYIQTFESTSFNPGRKMMYAGMVFGDGDGVLQLGIDENAYNSYLKEFVLYAVTNRRQGADGYVLIVLKNGLILSSYHDEHTGQTIEDAGIHLDPDRVYTLDVFEAKVFGTRSNVVISSIPICYIVGVYPLTESLRDHVIAACQIGLFMVVTFTLLFAVLFFVLKRFVVNSIVDIAGTMNSIAAGHLEERVDVHTTVEFDSLSSGINDMVDTLKQFIEAEKNRNAKELSIARDIQLSAMPGRFPPYPDRGEFSIYASIHAAHEVGGDFYDFYLLDDTLVFLIADVSGKGIPAAMFMMRAKTIIRSMVESGLSPAEAFTQANRKLCAENSSGMFVTAWIGCLDVKTGVLKIANAGHNPALRIHGGQAEYLQLKPGLMLGALDIIVYQTQELRLEPGDCIYLYTDGVTEAMDVGENLYGEERLRQTLTRRAARGDGDMCEGLCDAVLSDVHAFSEGAEQADDITMLCVRYEGQPRPQSRQA